MIQLHQLLIGIILIGMVSTGMVIFLNAGVQEYSPSSYDNTSFESFNQLEAMSDDINSFDTAEEGVSTDTDISDILGSFFTNMYQSAKVFKGSVGIMNSMVDESIEQVPTGSYSSVLKSGLNLMIMIAVFVGIFLAFVTKSERT